MKLFKSLRHSAFALLFSGQMLSRLGDSTYKIALAWWILDFVPALVYAAYALPWEQSEW